MPETIRIFVGYDPDEALAFSVFAHSVHRRSRVPVSIQPVMLSQLRGLYHRDRDPLQSTEFSFSRFLVPWLCGFKGWAVFCDGDMLCRNDIAELWELRDPNYSVQVVKREQEVTQPIKFLGRPQSAYPRKNWSSVMIFNCDRCSVLTPEYVATAHGLDLHGFKWLQTTDEIGDIPAGWNHLVGVDAPSQIAKLVHFTLGMPFFRGFAECEFAQEWREEMHAMMAFSGRGC